MLHLPPLITDLALILATAGAVTVLFKKIRQPVVLGYLIAGLLVGHHFPLFPDVVDSKSVQIWAEIGIIFLLFSLGLEFSFKKLAKVGGPAAITAITEVVVMLGVGFLTGKVLGWSTMDCLFLGGILAISSTTIIIRAFEEAGVKGRHFVSLVFGALIVEDLVAILLMVLLSTLAVSQSFQGGEMFSALLKLGFFLTLWFLMGIFIIPSVLRRYKSHMQDETLLIVSVALCFSMVALAYKAGFSPALGAFIMGSILAETTEAERVEHLIKPVKDLFAAIFFVSVGMLIDPNLLVEYAGPVLIITLVTIIFKTLGTMLGALLSGQSLKHSVQAGFSLAQIGEFSFIIAGLGQSLNVTSPFLYPIAVGVSVITTFCTPYMIKYTDRAYVLFEKSLPSRLRDVVTTNQGKIEQMRDQGAWAKFVQYYLIRVLSNGVVIAAIMVLTARYLLPVLSGFIDSTMLASSLGLLVALLFSAPFLWALALRPIKSEVVKELWQSRRNRALLILFQLGRIALAFTLFIALAPQFISLVMALAIAMGFLLISFLLFSKRFDAVYYWIENRFMLNLSEREDAEAKAHPQLAPWDAHIVYVELSPNSPIIGLTLEELKIREQFGVSIVLIERGSHKITAPTRNERIYPFDRLSLVGTDEQIAAFKSHVDAESKAKPKAVSVNFALFAYTIGNDSEYIGKTIRNSGLREKTSGLVVGIERSDKRILNPDSTEEIKPGDLLWIVGDESYFHKA